MRKTGKLAQLSKMMNALATITLLGMLGAAPDVAIDRHALLASPEVEHSVAALAQYLTQPATGERDKALAIFRWMADRIRYDVDALVTDHPGETRPAGILQIRKARGMGYATLFEALARQAGLEVVIIPGFVKGMFNPDDDRPLRPNHAWNAVKIDGVWQLVDTSLGAGFVRGKHFHRVYQEQFFLPPPQHLILTHFPADARWQLVPWPIAARQWDMLPQVDLQLLSMGVSFESLWRQMKTPGFRGFVRVQGQHTDGKVLAAPVGSSLVAGRDYHFLLEAPQVNQMFFVQKDRWVPLHRNGTRFEGIVRPEAGHLRINVQRTPGDRTTYTMMGYQVGP